jgi:hypothetical protein
MAKNIMTSKVIINRSKLPTPDDEYTTAQRRIIDGRLAESEDELRKGRTHGPFSTAGEMIAHLKAELKKRVPTKKTKLTR